MKKLTCKGLKSHLFASHNKAAWIHHPCGFVMVRFGKTARFGPCLAACRAGQCIPYKNPAVLFQRLILVTTQSLIPESYS